MHLKDLLSLEKFGLKHLQGSLETKVSSVKPPELAAPDTLVFVGKPHFAEMALAKGAKVLVKTADLHFDFPKDVTLFQVPSVSAGFAMILPFFDQKSKRFEKTENHFVHSTAQVASDVIIGHGTHIGARTIIKSGTRIGHNVVIENDCVIGEKSTIHSQVFIGTQCLIGRNCEIHPNTTIGSDGFGYVQDPSTGVSHKIPQIGIVVIEDNVEIGANCAIDRATLTETRIKSGTKMDNLIHIAHNTEIGENSILIAGFMSSGSTKTGKRFIAGGQSAIKDHVTIADNVTIAARSGVTNDITEPGVYGGFPAVGMQQFLKTQLATQYLPDILKWWKKNSKNN